LVTEDLTAGNFLETGQPVSCEYA